MKLTEARPKRSGWERRRVSEPTGFARRNENRPRFSRASDSGRTKTAYVALTRENAAAAEAIRQRADERREQKLHQTPDRHEESEDLRPLGGVAGEAHDQPRQDGDRDAEAEGVQDDRNVDEGQRGLAAADVARDLAATVQGRPDAGRRLSNLRGEVAEPTFRAPRLPPLREVGLTRESASRPDRIRRSRRRAVSRRGRSNGRRPRRSDWPRALPCPSAPSPGRPS